MTDIFAKAPRQFTHPLVFLLLIIPFGAASGFLTVTVVYLLGKAGVSPTASGALVAASFFPHTIKFLYAPLVDLTFKRKQWFITASITSAIGIAALGMIPPTNAGLALLSLTAVLGNFATAFLSMSVESLMVYNTAPQALGRTAGWFQAGNLGGSGLGGGLAMEIAQRTSHAWLPGVVLAVICLLTGIAILFTNEPEPHPFLDETPDHITNKNTPLVKLRYIVWPAIRQVLRDLWEVASSRTGYLGLVICFLPIGSGAGATLFPQFATEWQVSATDVGLTTGTINGLLSALGCLIGGYFCDRMDRKLAYGAFGVIMAICAVFMAWAPHNRIMFYVFVLTYGFITGLCFASFTAVTLEAIGKGAAATKYSIFASLSNTPIAYMNLVNGYFYENYNSIVWLHSEPSKTYNSNAGLYSDAACGIIGILVFLLIRAFPKQIGWILRAIIMPFAWAYRKLFPAQQVS